jgi:hypothetical protein
VYCCKYGFQSDTIIVSVIGHHIVYAGYTKWVHRVMNWSKTQKFIELWTNKKQTGDSALVQSRHQNDIH